MLLLLLLLMDIVASNVEGMVYDDVRARADRVGTVTTFDVVVRI